MAWRRIDHRCVIFTGRYHPSPPASIALQIVGGQLTAVIVDPIIGRSQDLLKSEGVLAACRT